MAAFKTDGTFTTATVTGKPRKYYHTDGDNTSYIIDQDYIVLADNYTVSAFTATHPGDNTAYFVGDSQLQDLGGGVARFTRSFANKPTTRDEYETYAYNFIGFMGVTGINVEGITGRERFTQVVLSKVTYTYYRIAASGADYTTAESVPLDTVQEYYLDGYPTLRVDYLMNNPPWDMASSPTRTAYDALIAAGTYIVVECAVRRWRGSFYERASRRVKAI